MKLEKSHSYHRVIRPAIPSNDRKFLLKLLQLEIAAHPPQAAVVSLTLTAEAGQSSKVQLGLFAPPAPEPSRLDVTLARLKAMVGSDRVGSPVLHDSHRPGQLLNSRLRSRLFHLYSRNNPHLAHPCAAYVLPTHSAYRSTLKSQQPFAMATIATKFKSPMALGNPAAAGGPSTMGPRRMGRHGNQQHRPIHRLPSRSRSPDRQMAPGRLL